MIPDAPVFNPAGLGYTAEQITSLPGTYSRLLQFIDRQTAFARTMNTDPQRGTKGQWEYWWKYHEGFGKGTLFLARDGRNMVAVNVSCPGDIGDNDLRNAYFDSGLAYWLTQSDRLQLTHAAFIYPSSTVEDGKVSFFYAQTRQGILRLEVFGSDFAKTYRGEIVETRWFRANHLGQSQANAAVNFAKMAVVPLFIDENAWSEYLILKRDQPNYVISWQPTPGEFALNR